MLGYLMLLFIIVPVVELTLLIKVGGVIGAGNTIAIVILTGISGAYLAKMQGMITLKKIQDDLAAGRMPSDHLFDGFVILCSGLLLLTPGFITDCVGFMGLIPLTRLLFKKWLKMKLKDMMKDGKTITITSFKSF